MRCSPMILLMRRNLGRRESHHRQKLCEKFRAEMPPRMPEEILWGRRETAKRRSFQFRMEHIGNDERPGFSPALLNDPERITAMQQQ